MLLLTTTWHRMGRRNATRRNINREVEETTTKD
jgi:hypothetical protein